jgi:hypothetical protein
MAIKGYLTCRKLRTYVIKVEGAVWVMSGRKRFWFAFSRCFLEVKLAGFNYLAL